MCALVVISRFFLSPDPDFADPNSDVEVIVIDQPSDNHHGCFICVWNAMKDKEVLKNN